MDFNFIIIPKDILFIFFPSIIRINKIVFNIAATVFVNNIIRDIIFKKYFDGKKVFKYLKLFEEKVRIYEFVNNE